MRRVLRCDGLLPAVFDADGFRGTRPDDIRAIRQWLAEHGGTRPGFDIIAEGETPTDDPSAARAQVEQWREAGCTWWVETRWQAAPDADPSAIVEERLSAGPPGP